VEDLNLIRQFNITRHQKCVAPQYAALREEAYKLARMIIDVTEPSKAQDLAIIKLKEAVVWAEIMIREERG